MTNELLLIGGATPRMMERFDKSFTIHKWDEVKDSPDWPAIAPRIKAVATNGHDGVKPEIMAALPNLAVISCYGVGYDAIDTSLAAKRGIMVTHTPNVLNADVANLAILLMLATSRCLVRDEAWARSGKWAEAGNAPLSRSIEHKKVGILGLGRIGSEIARKLAVFNCDISYHSRNKRADVPYPYYDNLSAMAGDVDYLIAITTGGPATQKIINREVLDALGSEGTLINVARGSVVDEHELILALREGRLGWAGLDVFENEPHIPAELCAMENVTLTPHVASGTVETRQAMGDLTVDNLVQFFEKGTVISAVPECQDLPSAS